MLREVAKHDIAVMQDYDITILLAHYQVHHSLILVFVHLR